MGKLALQGAHGNTHRGLAVILFADLAAVLTSHSYRMTSLLGKARVVHNPGHYRGLFLHGWQNFPPHLRQHLAVVPGRVRHQMVQGLVHAANIVPEPSARPSVRRSCARPATTTPCSSSSTARAGRRAPRRWPGPRCMPRSASFVGLAKRGRDPTKQFYIKLLLYNTVILEQHHGGTSSAETAGGNKSGARCWGIRGKMSAISG